MAFPPPFRHGMPLPAGAFAPGPPRVAAVVPFTQKYGFFSPQAMPVVPRVPRPTMINVNVGKDLPKPAVPITTVFVGNISEKCSDEMIQRILTLCGSVQNWKRMKAFGFCDFSHPDGTMNALKVLNDYQLGDKRLTVKADEATSKIMEEFVTSKKRPADVQKADNGGGGGEQLSEEQIRANIGELIALECRELLPENNPVLPAKDAPAAKGSRSRSREKDSRKRTHRKRSSDSDGSASKKRRHHSSDSSASSRSSRSSSSSGSSSRSSRRSHHKSTRRRSRSRQSEDSEELNERRRLRREIKEKEESYLKRLEKWEAREKRMAKQYEKEEEAELQRKKNVQLEAKKLRQFLEFYEDERDDRKYYERSALFTRRQNYEREREADAKDRQEEQEEIEALKKQILADNKDVADAGAEAEAKRLHDEQEHSKLRHVRADSGSPTPHRPLGYTAAAEENGGDGTPASLGPTAWEESAAPASPTKRGTPKLVATIAKPALPRPGVFAADDEQVEEVIEARKKLVPFEITREDRLTVITPEERKKLVKELIERIPTGKEELFAFAISWDFMDEPLVEQRVRPWVNKKITDYIGEEEPSLVSFICEKIAGRVEPHKILSDLAMVLDEEAEVFTIKLWRLIIYESEAKRLGLSSGAAPSTDSKAGGKSSSSSSRAHRGSR